MQPDLVRAAFEEHTIQARIWRSTLAILVGLLCISAGLVPLIDSAYDARLARDAARTPVTSEESLKDLAMENRVWQPYKVQPWYNLKFAYAAPLGVIQVLSFSQPADETITPPPGLPRWPQPGEVFASEAVLDIEGGVEFVSAYGRLAGVVSPDSLADPGDRILYAGVDPAVISPPEYWLPVDGFGAPVGADGDTGYLGGALSQAPRSAFFVGLACFCLAPGILLTGVALRLGSDRRDRTVLTLRALGASTGQVAGSIIRSLVGPVAMGALVALLVLIAMSFRRWTVPFVGLQIHGSDMRPGLPMACVLIITVSASVITLGILAYRPWRARSLGPALVPKQRSGPRFTALWVTATAIAVANWGYVAFAESNPDVALYIRLLCVAVAVVALAPAVTPLLAWLSRSMGWLARLRSSGSLLVASRDLKRFGRASGRLAAVAGMMVILGMQIQVIVSSSNAQVQEATRALRTNDGRVLMTMGSTGTEDFGWIREILARSNSQYATLYLSGETPPRLIGTCENLMAAVERCPTVDAPVGDLGIVRDELRLYGISQETPVHVMHEAADLGIDREANPLLLYVSRTDSAVPREQVIADLAEVVQPVPVVEAVGQSQGSGAQEGARQSLWLAPAIIVAFSYALIASIGALLLEVERAGDRIRFLLRLARYRDLLSFSVAFVGAPIMLVTLVGVGVGAAFVAAPVRQSDDYATISGAAVLALIALGVLAAMTASVAASLLLRRTQ